MYIYKIKHIGLQLYANCNILRGQQFLITDLILHRMLHVR